MQAIFVETMSLGGNGPTVAVKDTIDVAGLPTRAGSRFFADAPPASRHADVVQALLDAGCRLVGKTNLHELAFGVTGINDWTGTPANPKFPNRIPGGSSSGSAVAVAAGLVDLALGTDTGGSIRVPAACCGIVGLKPSFGRISRAGVMPTRSSLDCVGPFARSVALIERAMAMLDPGFAIAERPSAWRLGVVEAPATTAVTARLQHALSAIGGRQVSVALRGMAAAFEAGIHIIAWENWQALRSAVDSPMIGPDIRKRLLAGGAVTAETLAAAEVVRLRFTEWVDRSLEELDALILPTLPAPTLNLAGIVDSTAVVGMTSLVRPFNLSGHPAITLPLAPADGYSAGLQLVGRRGGDAALCALAGAINDILETDAS